MARKQSCNGYAVTVGRSTTRSISCVSCLPLWVLSYCNDRLLALCVGVCALTACAGAVVPGLLDAMSVCESKGDEADREVWRHRLFNYLDKAFGVRSPGWLDDCSLAMLGAQVINQSVNVTPVALISCAG
jgi:hypothetical protein